MKLLFQTRYSSYNKSMPERPILYSFRRCPYAMRARMALLASEQAVTLREVLLRDKPQAMLDASEKGTVPVLVLDDGVVVDESIDVMHWALKESDPENWLASIDTTLIEANDGWFKQALDHYKYPSRYDLEDAQGPRAKGLEHLKEIDDRLSGQRFLAGDQAGFADNAIFPFIRQFSMVDEKWFASLELSNLKRWLAGLLESERFETAMVKYAPWQDGDAETLFP